MRNAGFWSVNVAAVVNDGNNKRPPIFLNAVLLCMGIDF